MIEQSNDSDNEGVEVNALEFLQAFPIGKRFECHVKVVNKYFAAVKPETVYANAVVSLVVLALFGVLFFVAIFRATGSFIKFRRLYIWDSERETWIVKRSNSLSEL